MPIARPAEYIEGGKLFIQLWGKLKAGATGLAIGAEAAMGAGLAQIVTAFTVLSAWSKFMLNQTL